MSVRMGRFMTLRAICNPGLTKERRLGGLKARSKAGSLTHAEAIGCSNCRVKLVPAQGCEEITTNVGRLRRAYLN